MVGENTKDRYGKIGVLMGGPSSEREISLQSGKAVFDSLAKQGLDAVTIDIKTDKLKENQDAIRAQAIDCAFIALHGYFGEDGQMQRILDDLKVPYTGSGAMASKLAMDKIASREIFEVNGLRIPKYKALNKGYYSPGYKKELHLALPLVIKPANHGSSIGLSIIDSLEELDKAVHAAFGFDDNILIEEYIRGREMTVAILGVQPLPVIEIAPKKRFFDFEAKYQPGMTDYIMPAKISSEETRKVQETALFAHNILGCYAISRVDMILDDAGLPFVLEVNTIPGLTHTSLVPKAASAAGIGFDQLCVRLIELAYEKAAKAPGEGR